MYFTRKNLLLLFCVLFSVAGLAQEDSLDMDMDLDFLFETKSELKISIGYSSNTLSAGRDYNVPQAGIFPSIRYYHKSGLMAGLSGTWLQEADPSYSITNLSAGYSKILNDEWMLDLTYTHSFYNPDSNALLTNSISASVLYAKDWFNTGFDYSYLAGPEEDGHQLVLSAGGFIRKNTKGIISGINIAPTVSGVLGTANSTLYNIPLRQYRLGTGETWQRFRERILNRINNRNSSDNPFGWLNTELSLPVSITAGKFSLLLAYTYCLPVQFEGETEKPEAKGFFNSVLTFTL